LNELFLKKFNKDNKNFVELMEDWWCDEDKKFKEGHKLIPIQELKMPYIMLNTMIYRVYGEDKRTHFKMEWIPMAYIVVKKSQVFNWE